MSKKKHIEILERLLEDGGFFNDVFEFRSNHSIPEEGFNGIQAYLKWTAEKENRKALYKFIEDASLKFGYEVYLPLLNQVLPTMVVSNQVFEQSLEELPFGCELFDGNKMNLDKMPDFKARINNSVVLIIDPNATHPSLNKFISDETTYERIKEIRSSKGQDPNPAEVRESPKRHEHNEIYKLHKLGYLSASTGIVKKSLPDDYNWVIEKYTPDNIKVIIHRKSKQNKQ